MSNAEIFYLCLVVGAMAAFGVTLAYCSAITSRRETDRGAAPAAPPHEERLGSQP